MCVCVCLGVVHLAAVLLLFFSFPGVAAQVQPPGWLRGQVLLLPDVPRRGLHGVEPVLRPGSSEQVTRLLLGAKMVWSLPVAGVRGDARFLWEFIPGSHWKRGLPGNPSSQSPAGQNVSLHVWSVHRDL